MTEYACVGSDVDASEWLCQAACCVRSPQCVGCTSDAFDDVVGERPITQLCEGVLWSRDGVLPQQCALNCIETGQCTPWCIQLKH